MKVKREVKLALTAIVAVVILIWGINFLKAKALFDRNNVFYEMCIRDRYTIGPYIRAYLLRSSITCGSAITFLTCIGKFRTI